jgi:hypothetical protein
LRTYDIPDYAEEIFARELRESKKSFDFGKRIVPVVLLMELKSVSLFAFQSRNSRATFLWFNLGLSVSAMLIRYIPDDCGKI